MTRGLADIIDDALFLVLNVTDDESLEKPRGRRVAVSLGASQESLVGDSSNEESTLEQEATVCSTIVTDAKMEDSLQSVYVSGDEEEEEQETVDRVEVTTSQSAETKRCSLGDDYDNNNKSIVAKDVISSLINAADRIGMNAITETCRKSVRFKPEESADYHLIPTRRSILRAELEEDAIEDDLKVSTKNSIKVPVEVPSTITLVAETAAPNNRLGIRKYNGARSLGSKDSKRSSHSDAHSKSSRHSDTQSRSTRRSDTQSRRSHQSDSNSRRSQKSETHSRRSIRSNSQSSSGNSKTRTLREHRNPFGTRPRSRSDTPEKERSRRETPPKKTSSIRRSPIPQETSQHHGTHRGQARSTSSGRSSSQERSSSRGRSSSSYAVESRDPTYNSFHHSSAGRDETHSSRCSSKKNQKSVQSKIIKKYFGLR